MSTLGAELSLVSACVDIEKARFEDRLTVVIDIPEGLHAAVLPPLLVQPLGENAIKHGIASYRRRGLVTLSVRVGHTPQGSAALVVTVEDSGPGVRSRHRHAE